MQGGRLLAFLSVNIISPAQATTAICGTLHIEVEVSGGDPDFVELFKNHYDGEAAKETGSVGNRERGQRVLPRG